MDEQGVISEAYERAMTLYKNEEEPHSLAEPYANHLKMVIDYQEQRKGVLAVLVTLLVKKLHAPSQDIRQQRAGLDGGFSGRSLDTKIITPFMKAQKFPSMSESGWLTRSFEQNHPFNLDFPGKISPGRLKEAFLGLVDGVQCQGLSADDVLLGLLLGLIRFRDRNTNLILSRPVNLTVAQVVNKVCRHHSLPDAGVARLPVLAVHAILTILAREVDRYGSCTVLQLEHHNTADTRTDLIGDVHIVDANDSLFEGYEVKHNIPISSGLIETSFEKLRTTPVKKFYILTTYQHDSYAEFEPDIQRVAHEHGCELTVNGVDATLRYYLRLIGDTREFVNAYVTHLETDPSVTFQLKKAWNEIVAS